MTHSATSGRVVSDQPNAPRAATLARHCPIESPIENQTTPRPPVDTILFSAAGAAIGEFRCPVGHAAFRDSGPIERAIVVFPRTSVWIRHEGSRPFVADPNVVTIYNRAQRYEREPLSPEGDRCDWFAVPDDVAREIAGAFEPAARDSEDRPFRFESAPSTPALYLRQRRLAGRARAEASALELEEEIVGVVTEVLAAAYRRHGVGISRRESAVRRRRDLVEHAKAELAKSLTVNRSASDIAEAVGTSVFHLCRVFRAQTERSMHEYHTELRVRVALELLADAPPGTTLSAIANTLGFASHSHLVRVWRRHLDAAPARVRQQLRSLT